MTTYSLVKFDAGGYGVKKTNQDGEDSFLSKLCWDSDDWWEDNESVRKFSTFITKWCAKRTLKKYLGAKNSKSISHETLFTIEVD